MPPGGGGWNKLDGHKPAPQGEPGPPEFMFQPHPTPNGSSSSSVSALLSCWLPVPLGQDPSFRDGSYCWWPAVLFGDFALFFT